MKQAHVMAVDLDAPAAEQDVKVERHVQVKWTAQDACQELCWKVDILQLARSCCGHSLCCAFSLIVVARQHSS